MKIYISSDEWYPVYSFEEAEALKGRGVKRTITKKKLAHFKRVFAEFVKVQAELKEMEGGR